MSYSMAALDFSGRYKLYFLNGIRQRKFKIIFNFRVFLKFHKWNEECHRLTVSRD